MADKSVDFLNQDSGGIGNPMLDLRRERLEPTHHGVKNLLKLCSCIQALFLYSRPMHPAARLINKLHSEICTCFSFSCMLSCFSHTKRPAFTAVYFRSRQLGTGTYLFLYIIFISWCFKWQLSPQEEGKNNEGRGRSNNGTLIVSILLASKNQYWWRRR